MRRKHVLTTTAIAAAAMAAAPLAASAAADKIDIASWNQEDLYDGWSAEQLFDTEVRGSTDEGIGEIENLVVNADGQVTKVIIEAGGVFDIGDTHFAVPWDQVEFGPDMEWVKVPVDQDSVGNFSLFEGDEDVATGPRAWKTSELINDYVALQDERRYGMVEDLVFDRQGELQAVVVIPDVRTGAARPLAYPYYGYSYGQDFDPGAGTYDLPYTLSEVQELGPFDYSRFQPRSMRETG